MSLGSRLQELRLKYNLSQNELAQMLRISTSAIGMYERNERKPNPEMLTGIATIFNVSVNYLLGMEKLSQQISYFNSVGEYINQLCKENEMTIEELSKRSKIPLYIFEAIEKEFFYVPPIDTLNVLSNTFKFNIFEFYNNLCKISEVYDLQLNSTFVFKQYIHQQELFKGKRMIPINDNAELIISDALNISDDNLTLLIQLVKLMLNNAVKEEKK